MRLPESDLRLSVARLRDRFPGEWTEVQLLDFVAAKSRNSRDTARGRRATARFVAAVVVAQRGWDAAIAEGWLTTDDATRRQALEREYDRALRDRIARELRVVTIEVISGHNPDGGSIVLTFPATTAGRRRARRYARRLTALFGWATVTATT